MPGGSRCCSRPPDSSYRQSAQGNRSVISSSDAAGHCRRGRAVGRFLLEDEVILDAVQDVNDSVPGLRRHAGEGFFADRLVDDQNALDHRTRSGGEPQGTDTSIGRVPPALDQPFLVKLVQHAHQGNGLQVATSLWLTPSLRAMYSTTAACLRVIGNPVCLARRSKRRLIRRETSCTRNPKSLPNSVCA